MIYILFYYTSIYSRVISDSGACVTPAQVNEFDYSGMTKRRYNRRKKQLLLWLSLVNEGSLLHKYWTDKYNELTASERKLNATAEAETKGCVSYWDCVYGVWQEVWCPECQYWNNVTGTCVYGAGSSCPGESSRCIRGRMGRERGRR